MKKRLFVILLSLAVMAGLSFTVWAADGVVAKIGDQEYTSLGGAVAHVPTDGTETTIVLTNDITGLTTDQIVTIAEGQNIVLDMAGHSITVDSAFTGRPIVNNGTLLVTGNGTISSEASELGGYGAILNNETGTLTIENGTFAGNVFGKGSAIRNLGDCVIHDGDFTGTAAVYNAETGDLTINDGNFHTTSCNQTINSAGQACWSYCISSAGNLVFKNGTVTGVQGALAIAGGTGVVYDGEFTTVACEHSESGATAFYAIYIAGETGNATASIYGGTYTAASKAAIMVGNDNQGGDGGINAPASVVVYGGDFNSQEGVNVMLTGPSTGNPVISGGTFSNNIVGCQGQNNVTVSDYISSGSKIAEDADGNQVVSVDEEKAIFKVNGVPYATLRDAVAAVPADGTQTTITLLKNAAGGGVQIKAGQNIIFDFGGYTYTVGAPTVGSAGTETNGFQLLNGSTVTMKNGTVKASDYEKLKILIQNYCDLTLEDIVLDAREAAQVTHVSSNNHGNVLITGSTSIYAAEGQKAFDVYYWPNGGYGEGVSVTVNTTGTIEGDIEYGSDGSDTGKNNIAQSASLEIKNGTIKGEISTSNLNENNDTAISVTGGTFDNTTWSDYTPAGNTLVPDGNGNYVIGVDEATAIAEVDDVGYMNVQDAIDAIDTEGTVTLLGNYTGTFTVPAGKTVTLDLNGKTLTHSGEDITVLGELVIEDSAGSGKLTSQGSIVVDGDTAKFTLESGALEFTNNYGIYCMNGATAIVNGGSIDSYYAPLTGNNTTGNMNFEINGGTLTAEYGPAIYMPGQGTLTITDGVLNGGISLRMGQVNISGGTINAITDNIDSPAEYYNYSGNAWFPDALYVIGGTYTSNDATNGNSFVLNITGGEFICNNGQGSAVAIYDLARTGQEANVDISGNAVLTTNSTTRLAYQVLTLADIGVETPDAGYGNAELVGKVDTEISGGTFSTEIPEEYLADGVEFDIDENGNYVIKTVVEISFVDGTTGKTFTGLATSLLVGDKIAEPAGTVKPGYTVEGWYTDAALTEEWDFENDVIPDTGTTLTLYAKFVPVQTAFEYPCSEDSITLDSGITAPKGYTYEFLWKDAKGAEIGTEASAQLKMPGAGSSAVYTLTVTATAQGGEVSTYTIVYTFSQDDHFGGKATCTHAARCSVCGERYGELDPDNHAYASEVRNAVAATMDREGYTGDTYCKGCGVMIKAGTIVPRLDHEHAFTRTDAKAATCTEDGNIEYYTCSVCGKIYEDAAGTIEISLADTVLPATGHSYGTEYEHNSAEHWHECATCGDRIDVGAHTFGEWTVTEEATATEDGSRERTCSVCGATETEVIPATGSGEETTAPTDTTEEATSNTGTIILWVVIAVVVVAAAAIIIVYVVKKKKGGDGSNGGNPNGSKPTGSGNSAQSASSPKSGSSGN